MPIVQEQPEKGVSHFRSSFPFYYQSVFNIASSSFAASGGNLPINGAKCGTSHLPESDKVVFAFGFDVMRVLFDIVFPVLWQIDSVP